MTLTRKKTLKAPSVQKIKKKIPSIYWTMVGKMPPLELLAEQIGIDEDDLEAALKEHTDSGLLKIENGLLFVNWSKAIPSC